MPRPAARRTRKPPVKPAQREVNGTAKSAEPAGVAETSNHIEPEEQSRIKKLDVAEKPTTPKVNDTARDATNESTPVRKRAASRAPSSAGS
ncbi:hypothetical protein KEM54_002451, partial [Ascosphaera aggregata]